MARQIYSPVELKNLNNTPVANPYTGNLFLYLVDNNLRIKTDAGEELNIGDSVFTTADFISRENISSNVEISIPANHRITSFVFEEINGNDVSINVGTSSGSDEIVNEELVNANSITDVGIGQSVLT